MKRFIFCLCAGVVLTGAVREANAETLYEKVVTQLQRLESNNPKIVKMFSIGKNDDGVEMYAIRISISPARMDRTKIAHLIVSTHHGNEQATPTFTMAFVDDLITRYRSDELWKENLADQEWTIVPVVNISGYNANRRREKNIDPNRDYAGPCEPDKKSKLKSVEQVKKLFLSREFTSAVSVHGYVGTFTYPWGVHANGDETLDNNTYAQITRKATDLNDYRYGTHTDIVYPANGTFEDWTYWMSGAWTILIELKSGSAADIKKTVPALSTWFNLLDSTPSKNYGFKYTCRRGMPDLRLE